MSRWVSPASAGLKSAGGRGPSDDVLDRIVKYVPAEVLAAFTMLFGVAAAMELDVRTAQWTAVGLIGAFLAATVAYVATRAPAGKVRTAHLAVSPVAFLAWAYPISSSLLGDWFFGLAAFAAQVVVVLLSMFIAPAEG
ncbi:MAG: hypothetical protein ACXW3O_05645 [Brevundimonas sp.]